MLDTIRYFKAPGIVVNFYNKSSLLINRVGMEKRKNQ